jgi:hypothetical protein
VDIPATADARGHWIPKESDVVLFILGDQTAWSGYRYFDTLSRSLMREAGN